VRVRAVPLVLGACGAFYAVFIARTAFSFEGRTYFALFDDGMISMGYGRSLAEGHGLTWPGAGHVEGYTNFLWTLWMAVVHLLPISPAKTSLVIMLTGAALLIGTMLIVRAICLRLQPERPLLAVVAMLLTGLFYPLVYWSLRGMEVSLAALLVAAAVLLALRIEETPTPRLVWALAGCIGLAVLTRDDLLLPCLVVAAYAVWVAAPAARRRVALILGGTLVGVVGGHIAFRLAYYGDALPNTYYLKLTGIPIEERLRRGGTALAYTWLFTLFVPMLLAGGYIASRRRSLPRGAVLLAAIVVVQSAYSLYVGGDAWEIIGFANRYVTTAAPLLMVLVALGLGELLSSRGRRLAPWLAGAFVAMAIVVSHDWLPLIRLELSPTQGLRPGSIALAVAGAVLVLAIGRLRPGAAGAGAALAIALAALVLVQVDHKPAGDWVRDNAVGINLDAYFARVGVLLREGTRPGTRIAVVPAGNTPYFADRPAIDMLGKMDRVIARRPPRGPLKPGHNKWDYGYSIGRLRPDVIALLWFATPAELCRIQGWGYRRLVHEFFVRNGSPGVNADLLRRRLGALVTTGAPTPLPPTPAHCQAVGAPE
jgi:arabinofuranosyltransferase